MGSEGYLLNQFLAKQVNTRTDAWGGSFDNRTRLALRIVEGIRAATAPDFIMIFRLSMLDLVKAGSDWPEVVALAQALEAAGVSIPNTGIGWHEARIPTIATKVPNPNPNPNPDPNPNPNPNPNPTHDRDPGAACGLLVGDAQAQGLGGHPSGRHQPDQHAGDRRAG